LIAENCWWASWLAKRLCSLAPPDKKPSPLRGSERWQRLLVLVLRVYFVSESGPTKTRRQRPRHGPADGADLSTTSILVRVEAASDGGCNIPLHHPSHQGSKTAGLDEMVQYFPPLLPCLCLWPDDFSPSYKKSLPLSQPRTSRTLRCVSEYSCRCSATCHKSVR
jgi:hypothetical protein